LRDAVAAAQHGKLAAPSRKTLRDAWEEWIEGATADPPTVRARGGRPFKPSVLRTYQGHMRKYVLDDLGGYRLTDLRRAHLHRLVERLVGSGLTPSTIRNVVMPIRAVYRREQALSDGLASPLVGLDLPTGLGTRDRVAGLVEARELIGLLPDDLRPLYATAFYAGLRRGELAALSWSDVDLASGLIHVRRSWDAQAGYVAPKSRKGTRAVPIMGDLRDHLTAHKARTGRDGADLVFGSQRTHPFTATNVRRKALAAWAAENRRRAEEQLEPVLPIALHELRHSCVTFMHEAALSLEEIGDLIGHSSTYMSDRYRHLRDDRRDQLAAKLDAYAALADTRSRLDQLEGEPRH
jgi:integrase